MGGHIHDDRGRRGQRGLHPHLPAELPRPCPNALPGLKRVKHRRVGRTLPLSVFEGADHAAQALALALERGDSGAGVLGFVEGLRVQGGHAPAAFEPEGQVDARGALPLAW
jgi:hypothetical protein